MAAVTMTIACRTHQVLLPERLRREQSDAWPGENHLDHDGVTREHARVLEAGLGQHRDHAVTKRMMHDAAHAAHALRLGGEDIGLLKLVDHGASHQLRDLARGR